MAGMEQLFPEDEVEICLRIGERLVVMGMRNLALVCAL